MTLIVRISNEGNQPTDGLMIRGVTAHLYGKEGEDGCIGSIAFGGDGVMFIPQGKSVLLFPMCNHFGDFDKMEIKGKH